MAVLIVWMLDVDDSKWTYCMMSPTAEWVLRTIPCSICHSQPVPLNKPI